MEIQLQELIEQIKKDGVEAAESKAAAILADAQAQAEQIISDANAEADRILESAKKNNESMVKVSEDAIRQAGRNMLLSFRQSVAREINAVVNSEVAKAYSADAMPTLIAKVVEAWTKNNEAEDISLLLNSNDLASLEGATLAALKNSISAGVTLEANDSFDKGFRIAVKDGSAYYDYSAEAVTEMMSSYLSPKVLALLKEAEGI